MAEQYHGDNGQQGNMRGFQQTDTIVQTM